MVAVAPALSPSHLVELEEDWASWLLHMFGGHDRGRDRLPYWFAPYHEEFWQFIQAIPPTGLPFYRGREREAFISIWPRGGAKTSSMEFAVAKLAAERRRKFGVVISETLGQANERVQNVAELLTTPEFARQYPEAASRWLHQYGKGRWSNNHIQTASGFNFRAFGLDSPMRGAQIGNERPDLIILDDIDSQNDSPYMTNKKEGIIARAVLPMMAPGAVVFGLQNLILSGGIFDRLRTNADYLANRYVSGPHPAIRDPQFEAYQDEGRTKHRIVGGEPVWKARGIEAEQGILDTIGLTAYRVESLHQLDAQSDRTYPQFDPERHAWRRTRRGADGVMVPDLPKFDLLVGGIDYGGEGDAAHPSALMLSGYVEAADLLIFIDEWEDNGASVDERQRATMYAWQEKYGNGDYLAVGAPRGRIYWRGGADQYRENARLRRVDKFAVQDSDRSGPVRAQRERWLGDRLGSQEKDAAGRFLMRPRLYYLEETCALWALQMQRLKRKMPRTADEEGKRETISIYDDSIQAGEYAIEEIELVHRRGVSTVAKEVTA